MKSHAELVDEGFLSLIQRFGKYLPDTEEILEDLLIKMNEGENSLNEEDIVILVNHYSNKCTFYLNHIEEMSEYEIEAFIWHIVMRLDIIRGIFPGLNNGDPLNINSKLEVFENQMWNTINQYFDV